MISTKEGAGAQLDCTRTMHMTNGKRVRSALTYHERTCGSGGSSSGGCTAASRASMPGRRGASRTVCCRARRQAICNPQQHVQPGGGRRTIREGHVQLLVSYHCYWQPQPRRPPSRQLQLQQQPPRHCRPRRQRRQRQCHQRRLRRQRHCLRPRRQPRHCRQRPPRPPHHCRPHRRRQPRRCWPRRLRLTSANGPGHRR